MHIGALTSGAVLFTLHTMAQTSLGVKAGPNLSSLTLSYTTPGGTGLNNTPPPDIKATGGGWHVGGYFNTTGGSFAGLIFELQYSRRFGSMAYDYTVSESGVDHRYVGRLEYEFKYIEVPLLLCVRPIDRLSIHAGGAAALLRSGHVEDRGERSSAAGQVSGYTPRYSRTDQVEELNRTSVELVLGGTVKVVDELLLGVRYLMDLNDLDPTSGTTAKSSLWQFSLCYEVAGAKKQE